MLFCSHMGISYLVERTGLKICTDAQRGAIFTGNFLEPIRSDPALIHTSDVKTRIWYFHFSVFPIFLKPPVPLPYMIAPGIPRRQHTSIVPHIVPISRAFNY